MQPTYPPQTWDFFAAWDIQPNDVIFQDLYKVRKEQRGPMKFHHTDMSPLYVRRWPVKAFPEVKQHAFTEMIPSTSREVGELLIFGHWNYFTPKLMPWVNLHTIFNSSKLQHPIAHRVPLTWDALESGSVDIQSTDGTDLANLYRLAITSSTTPRQLKQRFFVIYQTLYRLPKLHAFFAMCTMRGNYCPYTFLFQFESIKNQLDLQKIITEDSRKVSDLKKQVTQAMRLAQTHSGEERLQVLIWIQKQQSIIEDIAEMIAPLPSIYSVFLLPLNPHIITSIYF